VVPVKRGEKEVSLAEATAIGLGAIIGAGIFVLSGTSIALAGSYSLLAFIFIGVLSVLTALILGELATILPHVKGSTYSYAFEAFGHELGMLTGVMVYFSYSTSISAIAEGFGSYLSSLVGMHLVIPFAILLIGVLTAVNLLGIQKAAQTDLILVLLKLSVLSFFIAFAIIIALPHFTPYHFYSTPQQSTVTNFFSASVAIFFAYTGFQVITTFADKVRGGPRAAARAVMISVVVSMVFYVLVVLSMIILVPASEFKIVADPLEFALSYAKAPSWVIYVIDAGGLIATTSATLAMILASGRTLYQMSLDLGLPSFLKKYDEEKDVPTNTVILSSAIAVVTLFSGNIFVIASISNFGLLFSFVVSALALVHYRRKGVVGSYKTPFYPYSVTLTVVLLLSLLLGFPREALEINIGIMIMIIFASYVAKDIREERKR
jgi:APA family basic amino acid/polyamine antiporter